MDHQASFQFLHTDGKNLQDFREEEVLTLRMVFSYLVLEIPDDCLMLTMN